MGTWQCVKQCSLELGIGAGAYVSMEFASLSQRVWAAERAPVALSWTADHGISVDSVYSAAWEDSAISELRF